MKHIFAINEKPQKSGYASTPDGAITGNGDLAVILGNSENGMRIYLSKNDMWYATGRHNSGGVRPLGQIDIDIPPELYQSYNVEQDMDKAELRCCFMNAGRICAFTVRVLKTVNAVWILNEGNVPIHPVLKTFQNASDGGFGAFTSLGFSGIYRKFEGNECVYPTVGFAAIKYLSEKDTLISVATNHDCDNPQEQCIAFLRNTNLKSLVDLAIAHKKAWESLWQKSRFTCSDKLLENAWYASVYYMAITMGNLKFPPGLFGNFITVEVPSWHSDYHLNYNYQAPFYPALACNHPEFTDCYASPLTEFMPKGRLFARHLGCRGLYYPVGISPKGVCTETVPDIPYAFDRLFLGQKSNALHAADIMVFRWNATRDVAYAAQTAYPYIKECLAFFEDYGVWEKGIFNINNDAAHEVPIYRDDFKPWKYPYLKDKNNSLTIGLLKMCLPAAIDMAKALQTDEEKQRLWQNIYEHLPEFATFIKNGKRIYRYTQKGQAWHENNDVGLQHMYPAGSVGLDSDKKTLKIARNTYFERAKTAFDDDNAVSSFYAMGARLGIDSRILLKNLRHILKTKRYPNGLMRYGGGGTEYFSIAANALNEIVLQSYHGNIYLFPCHNTLKLDVSFETLRTEGAFLISSSFQNGKMGITRILSEQGCDLHLFLPCSGATVQTNGTEITISGNEVKLPTKPGQSITVIPVG